MFAPRVISLDLDDTLWPVAPVIAAAEAELWSWLQARHPRSLDGHDAESMRALRAHVAGRFPQRSHDLTFLRRRALGEQFAAAGYADAHAAQSPAQEAMEVFLAARNRVQFYADVRPALERLRSTHRLFAVSNGNADLARCGIGDLFDGHVTAASAGAAKPDPRIYAALVRLAQVAACDVLHIGDDPEADVMGAMRAGLKAAWLNRTGREWPAELAPPPCTVSTLAQIM
jgi:putative hydrolase of the HAD superfamily